MPEERAPRAGSEVAAREGGAPAPAERPPVPEPAYVLRPEGVPPLEVGGICRGRVGAVAESGHIALVNELVDIKATRAYLRRAKDDRTRVPGLVFGYNRGGFDVLVYGMRAFCPVSGLTIEIIDDPEPLLGQWTQFHVQAAKSGVQGLVVSRRSILEKEARKRARQLLKSLEAGQTVRGRVTQVRDFGVFVDIGGGVEGLVHQSELSWERGVKPEDVAKVGDELEVQILKVHERENKRERYDRVSLSLKALQPDPWKEALGDIVEGAPRKGTVVRTAEFGAFVQLAPGVDGLLHITELGRDLKHADQAVSVGDELHVVVERIDRKQRRISLSRLSPEDAEAFEKGELAMDASAPRIKQGGHVKVRVTQVSPAGLQVQVENVVGRRGRGFIPNAEMGTPRGTDHRRQWPPGTEMDVTIIGTDRDGGLRCSRKRFPRGRGGAPCASTARRSASRASGPSATSCARSSGSIRKAPADPSCTVAGRLLTTPPHPGD
ncbi:MAG: S1 RNA-binding domain-containing protein [Sandaracinaceae bacterium]|nr:S1 RNA-binding domain-containing protein [Sandaracinaceae bacterium]